MLKKPKVIFENESISTLPGNITLQDFNGLNPIRFKVMDWNTFSPICNHTKKKVLLSIEGECNLFKA